MAHAISNKSQFNTILKVLLAFSITHIVFRYIKQFTNIGEVEKSFNLNYTPGIIMIFSAVIFMFFSNINSGKFKYSLPSSFSKSSFILILSILYIIPFILFLTLHKNGIVIGFFAFIGHIIFTAIGEELFFRGYIQGELNNSFGHPWHFKKISFGVSLPLTACLFGFLHGLNTFNYYSAEYSFAWGWALITLLTGLAFGFIREIFGLLTAIISHGLMNVWIISFLMIVKYIQRVG